MKINLTDNFYIYWIIQRKCFLCGNKKAHETLRLKDWNCNRIKKMVKILPKDILDAEEIYGCYVCDECHSTATNKFEIQAEFIFNHFKKR